MEQSSLNLISNNDASSGSGLRSEHRNGLAAVSLEENQTRRSPVSIAMGRKAGPRQAAANGPAEFQRAHGREMQCGPHMVCRLDRQ